MDFSLEAIERRVSTRTFDGRSLREEDAAALTASFAQVSPGAFGARPRLRLVAAGSAGFGAGERGVSGKIGTYGLIARAPAFIVGAVSRARGAMEDFGYAVEGAVLRATELGLATCWIGGLFDRGAAARSLGLAVDELIPSVIAVGYPATGPSLAERFTRRSARAGTRKAFGELFFDGDLASSLVLPAGDPWARVLEAVRLGPSASNKQPWRILRTGSTDSPSYHLYLFEDRLYNAALGPVRIQNIDMGIAMRHFEAAARALGLRGAWTVEGSSPVPISAPLSWIASWR